ncbi:hypothetical protein Syun_016494 [Stephania yunnanensis]|uniref:TRAF-type domain-containing protein n=1 Tax=Stephania yunnanensis TaxID=152371 RepID=A0AAP0J7J7_9MAGN
MDPPMVDIELNQEKIEEAKEEEPLLCCHLFDLEVVHEIAQVLLPGLASACVDNTTGGLFTSPALVAVDVRNEMIDYLTSRSETYVAESVVEEGGPDAETCNNPTEIIEDFIDDFVSSKRNMLSRVSSWLLSDRREDRIDDLVQEMEASGFWLLDTRQIVANILLKNIDFKNNFHCDMKFHKAEELTDHFSQCSYRSVNCMNEGCSASFSALQREKHDAVCLFKVLPCEQNCPGNLMRHEMDRHCITVCPMKLVNCPFYTVGCKSTIPKCTIEKHCTDLLHSHVMYILQGIHKEAAKDDLKHRSEQLQKLSCMSKLSNARDLRSLTLAVKKLDAELGPIEKNLSTTACADDKEKTDLSTHVPEEPENLSDISKT